MDEVNRTLYIPLYGKSRISRMNIILHDPFAEKIWDEEGFPIRGKAASRWLAYNMAMRARVFDDWTDRMLRKDRGALVLHIGCGLDSRCERVKEPYQNWIDCDLPEVIQVRRKYYTERENYHMASLDASDPEQVDKLPERHSAIIVMEGLSMYLTGEQLRGFFSALQKKYRELRVLADIYTEFGAKASKFKNPVNEVGVTKLYGFDDVNDIIGDSGIRLAGEYSFTPEPLIAELKPLERLFFRIMFNKHIYRKIYRLLEFESDRKETYEEAER